MGTPARDMISLLESSAISAGEFEKDLFVGLMPHKPDNATTAYDTGGFEPESGYNYERPTVQFTVRNHSYSDGFALAQNIMDSLNGLYGVVVDGYRYIGIWAMNGPNSIGRDDNNRCQFTVNFRLHRTKQP